MQFRPIADMYATRSSHLVTRYYSHDVKETGVVGHNALSHPWDSEGDPFICPPLTTIPGVLENILCDGIRCMLVIPERTRAQWWPVFEGMLVQSCAFTKPHDSITDVNSPLRWRTIFAIVDGRLKHRQLEEHRVETPCCGGGGAK